MTVFNDLMTNRKLKLGTYIGEFTSPGIGAIVKAAGCEFVLLDMEHSGFSFDTAKAILRSLHDAGIATMLRPPDHSAHHIARACDIGAQAICPPMMGTPEQAQAVIDGIKYPPIGKRGAAFGIAHDDYATRPIADSIAIANARTSFMALIETAEGVGNVEEIAALPGCDGIWIGQLDLSFSLGIPGEYDDPLFIEATRRIIGAAQANEKSVGRLVTSVQEATHWIGEGCDLICYSGDAWLFKEALQQGFADIRKSL